MLTLPLGSCLISKSVSIANCVQDQLGRRLKQLGGPLYLTEEAKSSQETKPFRIIKRPDTSHRHGSPPSCTPSSLKRGRNIHSSDEDEHRPNSKRRRTNRGKESPVDLDSVLEGGHDRIYTREQLVHGRGMGLFAWDGKTCHILLDRENCVIGVLAGQPKDSPGWDDDCETAFRALHSIQRPSHRLDQPSDHRESSSFFHGIGIKQSCTEPEILCRPEEFTPQLESLLNSASLQRICMFGSCVFEMFCKRGYNHMKSVVDAIRSRDNELRHGYDPSLGVFPCRLFDLGFHDAGAPSRRARKGQPWSHSWTSVTALGEFDPRSGGHLVLWDLNLVIEFPPGSTIVLPFSLLHHTFIPVHREETRCVIEQFATSDLFRLVDVGDGQDGAAPCDNHHTFTRFDELLGDRVIRGKGGVTPTKRNDS